MKADMKAILLSTAFAFVVALGAAHADDKAATEKPAKAEKAAKAEKKPAAGGEVTLSGEMVCAVVTLADPADPIALDEIAEYMTEAGTMRQKIPERLEIIDEMPRNATGKIVKNDLRARYSE